jgi:hypothetical protein
MPRSWMTCRSLPDNESPRSGRQQYRWLSNSRSATRRPRFQASHGLESERTEIRSRSLGKARLRVAIQARKPRRVREGLRPYPGRKPSTRRPPSPANHRRGVERKSLSARLQITQSNVIGTSWKLRTAWLILQVHDSLRDVERASPPGYRYAHPGLRSLTPARPCCVIRSTPRPPCGCGCRGRRPRGVFRRRSAPGRRRACRGCASPTRAGSDPGRRSRR